MNYQQAVAKLSTARCRQHGKPIANNTRLYPRGESVAVQLHATDIVTFNPDGSVLLDTGGWKTVTTKARMNDYAPCQVFSDRGVWKVSYQGQTVNYADGMVLHDSGVIEGAAPATTDKREDQARKRVAKYAKQFIDALFAGEVPAPSGGDCWHCALREVGTGKPLGECTRDHSHIEGHMAERYFVPSLLVNAMRMFGASKAAEQTAMALMHGKPEFAFTRERGDWLAKQLEKIVRRYCLRQLGMSA